MSSSFVLIAMVFFHVLDDYFLQGILASMKQKDWWANNAPQKMYRYDYIVALVMHSLSWSFMIMLPIAIQYQFMIRSDFVLCFIFNSIAHAFIDNAKANWKTINLIADQGLHVIQIVATFYCFVGGT